MTLNYGEIVWWNTLVNSLLSLAASAVAFSSAVTNIVVNWQKNIIQHPYWGKIFPFQDDYAYVDLMIFSKTELKFVGRQAFISIKHGFFQDWGKC